jgi:hypothetical protein
VKLDLQHADVRFAATAGFQWNPHRLELIVAILSDILDWHHSLHRQDCSAAIKG